MLYKDTTYYYTSLDTFSHALENVQFFVKESYEIGMHKQEFFEINIVVQGSGSHHIEKNEIPAVVGDVFIIPPEMEHGYTGGEGFDVYHILVSNRFIERNITELEQIPGFSLLFSLEPMIRASVKTPFHLHLDEEQFNSILGILDDRKYSRKNKSISEFFECTGSFYIFLSRICDIYNSVSALTDIRPRGADASFMRALALIQDKYMEKLTIDRLAREAMLSRSSFVRIFKRICKCTPNEYITRRRLEVAEALLRNTNATVPEIAERVGFYDAAHMSRVFKAARGVSSTEFRRMSREMI